MVMRRSAALLRLRTIISAAVRLCPASTAALYHSHAHLSTSSGSAASSHAHHAFRRLGFGFIRSSTLVVAALHLTPRGLHLPHNQEDFSAYAEIDIPSATRIETIRRSGLGSQEWVALEKVHGTNFAVYLVDEKHVRFAKRSGIMDPNEHFFGYHVLADTFSAQVRIVADLIKQKFQIGGRVGRVVLHGELFGAKYNHPLVPKSKKICVLPNGRRYPISGVEIQREPFPQYSPELQFCAFDIKYSLSGGEEDNVLLSFDDFQEICSRVPNLFYTKPLVRGTLDDCLAFDVENFNTPIPALLGLGNYPLDHNLAEGVVIRHVRHGDPSLARFGVSTIIKLRCSSFMELKHPGKQQELKDTFFDTVRAGALQRTGGNVTVIADAMLPQVESAANALLLNHISDGRLSNVLSKVGREPLLKGEVPPEEVTLLLAKDALKDFLKDVDELVLNTSLQFRRTLVQNAYWAASDLVRQKWSGLLKEEQEAQAKEEASFQQMDEKQPAPQ